MTRSVTLHVLGGRKVARDVCELVERLFSQGSEVVVWLADPGRAGLLDDYLWTFSQSSFVPHGRWVAGGDAVDPVTILEGSVMNPGGAKTVVLAEPLHDVAGLEFFQEIHEVCGGAAEQERREFWRRAGFEVETKAARSS